MTYSFKLESWQILFWDISWTATTLTNFREVYTVSEILNSIYHANITSGRIKHASYVR